MAIFLHFLNREIYRAVNAEFSVAQACSWLRALVAGTSEPLLTNFANLLEGGFLGPSAPSFVRDLLAQDYLAIAGERASLAEFVESRLIRYGFDAARYPMYFSGSAAASEMLPTYVRTVSATDYLEGQIGLLARHELGLRDVVTYTPDIRLVGEALPTITALVTQRDASAITRSLFAGRLGSESHEAATARLLSAVYIRQQMNEFTCDIAAGLRPLLLFDSLGSGDYAHDVAILSAVLSRCGVIRPSLVGVATEAMLVALRGAPGHALFVEQLRTICRALGNYVSATVMGHPPRHYVQQVLAGPRATFQTIQATRALYEEASQNVTVVAGQLRAENKEFAEHFERQVASDLKQPIILFVTATKVETRALFSVAAEAGIGRAQYISKERYVAAELGAVNRSRLIAVQCEPGSVGPAGSQAVITDAIRDFAPIAVLLVGIAFGTKPDKQQLRDLLISKMVVEYERAKIKDGVNIPRGQRIEASPKLLSLFRAAEAQAMHLGIHVGTVLSGEKLVDNRAFLTELLTMEPEAIGGEMEGAGLVAAAARSKSDWMVIKAIVDWAHDKSAANTDDQQYEAARGAFSFVFSALKNIGL